MQDCGADGERRSLLGEYDGRHYCILPTNFWIVSAYRSIIEMDKDRWRPRLRVYDGRNIPSPKMLPAEVATRTLPSYQLPR